MRHYLDAGHKMKKTIAFVGSLAVVMLPMVVFAQGSTCSSTDSGLCGVVAKIKTIVNTAIPVAMAAAFIFFIVQVIKFITSKDAEKRGDARSGMLQGIIGFACIVGLWGLVGILLNTFGAQGGAQPDMPTF